MKIPHLTTERFELVPPCAASWDAYRRFYTDETASAMYGGPLSVRDTWSRLASDVGSWHLQGFGVWAIKRKREEERIGTCGFWRGKGWPRELTWWLLPNARGEGVATEASRAAIEYAYETFKWDAVETYMNDDNEAARALTVRLGGQKIDRRAFPDGLQRDVFLFSRSQ